jgi:hypothetical protein
MSSDEAEEGNEALGGIATITFGPFDVVFDFFLDDLFLWLTTL